MKIEIDDIKAENKRRNKLLKCDDYDPEIGTGCNGSRLTTFIPNHGNLYLPREMVENSAFKPQMSWNELCQLRFKYDFEYWCYACVPIKDKSGGGLIPFILNSAQRKVLSVFETSRLSGKPIRAIILKARQWGCSTMVQTYMAWIQIIHREYWNSLICAQVKDTSRIIKAMYERILANYSPDYWADDKKPRLKSVGGSSNIFEIEGRNSNIITCSSLTQENARGNDISMAHLSEVAFWKSSPRMQPESVIKAVCASITLDELTFVAVESTANGVGNYFHTEWLKASAGLSDKSPIFVAWHEIEIYRHEVKNVEKLWHEMDRYERELWNDGLTLEQINWYHLKRKEYNSHVAMMAEYPTDAIEAFNATQNSVFSKSSIDQLRTHCKAPSEIGELQGNAEIGPYALCGVHFVADTLGNLKIWQRPDAANEMRRRYVVAVDIGGRSDKSDYSVIAVFDRINPDCPELVAQWRGHVDHDILAWKAAMIAQWYCKATLIIESNTLETERTEGDHGEFILHELARNYRNLYRRDNDQPGFHTNRATKTMIINSLRGIIREQSYIERDSDALNEAVVYEQKPQGSFGAKEGFHDDIVITRALALSHCRDLRLTELCRLSKAESLRELLPARRL
ncbi:MAG: hypothetical protein PHR45_03720 [Muribaculaceae bacterium]|nr:hypothetical protein [Muribaculaceae bacterium]